MNAMNSPDGGSASANITRRIEELGDWRGATLARVRELIHAADPDVVEEWKWMGTPVWSHDGIICTGESYKEVVKLTFACGASLKDPKKLFNSSLEGNMRRAIDIREGEIVDATAFKELIRTAVAANSATKAQRAAGKTARRNSTGKSPAKKAPASMKSVKKKAARKPAKQPARKPARKK